MTFKFREKNEQTKIKSFNDFYGDWPVGLFVQTCKSLSFFLKIPFHKFLKGNMLFEVFLKFKKKKG